MGKSGLIPESWENTSFSSRNPDLIPTSCYTKEPRMIPHCLLTVIRFENSDYLVFSCHWDLYFSFKHSKIITIYFNIHTNCSIWSKPYRLHTLHCFYFHLPGHQYLRQIIHISFESLQSLQKYVKFFFIYLFYEIKRTMW